MRWQSLIAAMGVCALGACLIVRSARTQQEQAIGPKPRLVLQQPECDLGSVTAGTLLRGEFWLHNAGQRRLIVREEACSACGSSEWMIEPGASQRLTIEFDTAGLQGPIDHVRQFTTSDPRQPRLALVLRAAVQGPPAQ